MALDLAQAASQTHGGARGAIPAGSEGWATLLLPAQPSQSHLAARPGAGEISAFQMWVFPCQTLPPALDLWGPGKQSIPQAAPTPSCLLWGGQSGQWAPRSWTLLPQISPDLGAAERGVSPGWCYPHYPPIKEHSQGWLLLSAASQPLSSDPGEIPS